MAEERLQKILAAAGLGSRRACETLIEQGRVTVDGEIVTELGTKADPDTQEIACDGERVRPVRKMYYLINKPAGVVCTNDDERGRPRVIDLLPCRDQRLFTVGRLDANTEGLLIVTNDGAFAQKVAHPRFGITKVYRARVQGHFTGEASRQLEEGVWVAGHRCAAVSVRIAKRKRVESVVEVTMQEGRKREVRRMLNKVGHRVMHLERIRIGNISDRTLRLGKHRKLTREEVEGLLNFKPEPRRAVVRKRAARSPGKPSRTERPRAAAKARGPRAKRPRKAQ